MADKDTILIKTPQELVAYVDNKAQGLMDLLGEAEGKGAKLEAAFAELKTVVKDFARTRVPGVTEKVGRLPIKKADFVKYGMKMAIAAALPVERAPGTDLGYTCGDGPLATLHEANDNLILIGKLMGKSSAGELRELKYFASDYVPAYRAAESFLKAGFDIQTAGEGLEWVATDLSGSYIEMVRLARVAASLFRELPMQHGKLTVPTWMTDATAYGFDENTSDTGGTAIVDGLAGNAITTNFSMDAKGIGLALTTSKYMEEDSIIDWLPFLRAAGIQALVNAEEHAIFNGDTTATHMDADVALVTGSAAKRWKGLRYVGLLTANPAKTDAEGNAINSDDAFRDYMLLALGRMGKYGAKPGDLVLLVPAIVNAQLLSVDTFKNMYMNGLASTGVNGVIRSPFGWSYAMSEYLAQNLDATGVNTSAAATVDKTSALLVHTPSWVKGRVRNITVQLLRETRAKYDQDELVFTMRQAFTSCRKIDGTEPHVADIYDIKAA